MENDNEALPLYQHVPIVDQAEIDGDDDSDNASSSSIDPISAKRIKLNFIVMSISFSANHAAVVSCLSLATARLGEIGAFSSGILYSKSSNIQAKILYFMIDSPKLPSNFYSWHLNFL